ncbi:hypothetical protein AVEN_213322-1 [Araneus ventricosus]|uniref:Uncharacterized protein n=1 Tax=Araneus ventricosus TaxID=182803 RepID=A0A4Y2LMQ3_ARAVE|nr:hypothetical protein AVEN_213322-1 [Araneus ventricosus]
MQSPFPEFTSDSPRKAQLIDKLYYRPVLKQHEGYFAMDLVILNSDPMMRMTLELAPPSPIVHTTPAEARLTHVIFYVLQAHKQGGSSVISGFEPGASGTDVKILPQGPPRPSKF